MQSCARWVPLVEACAVAWACAIVPRAEAQAIPRPEARLDSFGDPLPPGALFRLGTTRLRYMDYVDAVAFSPDGRFLAGQAVQKNQIDLWEMPAGRSIRSLTVAGGGRFIFSPDSRWLALIDCGRNEHGGVLRLWNTHTQQLLTPGDPYLSFTALAFAPDHRSLAAIRPSNVVHVFDLRTGREIKTIPPPPAMKDAPTMAISFCGAGKFTVLSKLKQRLVAWDAVSGRQLFSLPAPEGLTCAAFSPDGARLALGGKRLSIRDAATGAELHDLDGQENPRQRLAFSPDGGRLVSGGGNGELHVWDVQTGRRLQTLTAINGMDFGVFGDRGATVATAGANGPHRIRLWDIATGKECPKFRGHDSAVSAVAFAPNGRSVATAAWMRSDPVVRLWDPHTGRMLREIETGQPGVQSLAFTPDGSLLATGGWAGNPAIRFWDAHSAADRGSLPRRGGGAVALCFTADGERLVTADANGTSCGIRAWNVKTRDLAWEHPGPALTVWSLGLSPDGRFLARGSSQGFELFSAANGNSLAWKAAPRGRFWRLAFSPDARLCAATSQELGTIIWEMASQTPAQRWPSATAVAFSPCGRFVALGKWQDRLAVFDLASGKECRSLDEHQTRALAFSPDGRRLVSGNADSTALVWDVTELGAVPFPDAILDARALEQTWSDLLSGDAAVAERAVWRMAAGGADALGYLTAKLAKAARPPKSEWECWVKDLGDDSFQVRNAAQQRLIALGHPAEGLLREALAKAPPLEVQRRLERILAELKERGVSEAWRTRRALAAVEHMPGQSASLLLQRLSRGHPGSEVTQLAREAIKRRKK